MPVYTMVANLGNLAYYFMTRQLRKSFQRRLDILLPPWRQVVMRDQADTSVPAKDCIVITRWANSLRSLIMIHGIPQPLICNEITLLPAYTQKRIPLKLADYT